MTTSARRRRPVREWERALPTRWGAGLLLATVVLQLLREQGVPLWDTVWIEDGPVYVQAANAGGVPVFEAYAGYLQLGSRLLALPTAVLPSTLIAAYLAVAGAVVWALAGAFVYRCCGEWIASVPCRLAVAAVAVLGPAVVWETNANITNTIWIGYVVVPFALVSTRDAPRDLVMRCVAVVVGATGTPLTAVFLPVAIGAVVVRRNRQSLVVGGAFVVGLVIQLAVMAQATIERGSGSSARLVADLYGLRVLGSALVGERPLDPLWTRVGEPAVLVIVAAWAVILGVLLTHATRPTRWRVALFLTMGVVAFVVPVLGRGTTRIGFDLGVYTLNMTRFTIVPIVLLVAAVAMLVDPADGGTPWSRADVVRAAFLVQTAIVVLVGWRVATVRGLGPTWSAEHARGVAVCASQPDDAVVSLTTTPSNFSVRLPCHRLR